jgi:predicted oxidoreductase
MKNIAIANGTFAASEIVLGCMRISGMSLPDVAALIHAAIDEGVNIFDHSDVYDNGRCEELFAQAMHFTPSEREKIIIQTKCGIRKEIKGYDFSKAYIVACVERSLKRLNTDFIDVLLLHRPDALFEPEEVGEAFSYLHSSGKVRHFGVSNHTPLQIELLNKYLENRIIADQLQFSIMHTGMIDATVNMNTREAAAINRDGGILEYCRIHGITIQAWSPFQFGFFEGVFIDNPKFPELNKVLERLANEKRVSKSAIAVAWILRHPARMQAIIGTTKAGRVAEICKATNISLTRQEWYEIYRAAGNTLP